MGSWWTFNNVHVQAFCIFPSRFKTNKKTGFDLKYLQLSSTFYILVIALYTVPTFIISNVIIKRFIY